MDGNNSLKRMRPLGGRKAGDTRVFEEGDYFLSQDFVNTYANEVRVKPGLKGEAVGADTQGVDDVDDVIPRPSSPDHDIAPDDPDTPAPLPLNQPCATALPVGRSADPSSGGADGATSSGGVDSPEQAPAAVHTHSSTTGTPSTGHVVDVEGNPTDGAGPGQSSCTKNWKAAQSDDKKRSWDVFEETGIFASACRHGFILWIIDMVRSGEL